MARRATLCDLRERCQCWFHVVGLVRLGSFSCECTRRCVHGEAKVAHLLRHMFSHHRGHSWCVSTAVWVTGRGIGRIKTEPRLGDRRRFRAVSGRKCSNDFAKRNEWARILLNMCWRMAGGRSTSCRLSAVCGIICMDISLSSCALTDTVMIRTPTAAVRICLKEITSFAALAC